MKLRQSVSSLFRSGLSRSAFSVSALFFRQQQLFIGSSLIGSCFSSRNSRISSSGFGGKCGAAQNGCHANGDNLFGQFHTYPRLYINVYMRTIPVLCPVFIEIILRFC